MMVYFDTSALVKKYCVEDGTDTITMLYEQADGVAISKVGRAEIFSAFYRKYRDGDITSRQLRQILKQFKEEWEYFTKVPINDTVDDIAEDLISRNTLRGFDAIHLATLMLLEKRVPGEWLFACADARLVAAAKKENIKLHTDL
jgi:hypothetical protein